MSEGPSPAAYNPNIQGGGVQAALANKPTFGIAGPPPLGSSIQAASQTMQKKIPANLLGGFDKPSGFSWKKKAQVDGNVQDWAADVRTAQHSEIFGSSEGSGGGGGGGGFQGEAVSSGQVILQNGAEMGGFFPEHMATGFGAVAPAATPSMGGRSSEMEL